MKNILILSTFILLINNIMAQGLRTIENYYDPLSRTKIMERYTVETQTMQKHGLYQYWNEFGILQTEVNYQNGVSNGYYKTFYPTSGSKEFVWLYNKGKTVEEVEYYQNGNKKYQKKINGGTWTIYYQSESNLNGHEIKWMEASLYENGKWRGETLDNQPYPEDLYMKSSSGQLEVKSVIFYYENGKISNINKFDNNYNYFSVDRKSYLENGELFYERIRIPSTDSYKETYYNKDSSKIITNYKLMINKVSSVPFFVKEGDYFVYNKNGKELLKGKYANDKPFGEWTKFFDKNWKPTLNIDSAQYYRKITYDQNGLPSGKLTDHYITGEKQFEGYMISDDPKEILNGSCIFYYKNGKISQESEYYKGILINKSKSYFDNGQSSEEWNIINSEEIKDNKSKESIIEKVGFNEKGTKIYETKYKKITNPDNHDIEFNPTIEFYELISWNNNGSKSSEGKLNLQEKKIGEWKIYSDDGKLTQVDYYDNNGNYLKSKSDEQALLDECVQDFEKNLTILYGEPMYGNPNIKTGGKLDKVEGLYVTATNQAITLVKKRKLYKAYDNLKKDLTNKINNSQTNMKEACKSCQLLILLCDKMINLININTDELEERLKKETDTQKILEVFELK